MFTQMEWHVLQTLNWIVGHPTVTGFLQLALTEGLVDPELEHMAWYISELALYNKEFIPVRPSTMARSSLALARCILNRPMPRYDQWSAEYDPQVVLNISNHLAQPSQALSRKYASHHLSSASTTVEMFLKHQAALATRISQTPVNNHTSMEIVEGPTTTNPYLTLQSSALSDPDGAPSYALHTDSTTERRPPNALRFGSRAGTTAIHIMNRRVIDELHHLTRPIPTGLIWAHRSRQPLFHHQIV